MPGRCFSLRTVLRDSLLLLVGTVMGILLSRALFDVPAATQVAISKRLTPQQAAFAQLHQDAGSAKRPVASSNATTYSAAETDGERVKQVSKSDERGGVANEVSAIQLPAAPGTASGVTQVVNNVASVRTKTKILQTKQSTGANAGGDGKTLSMQKRPKTLVEELGGVTRQPLFIGVVTSKNLLLTRGKTINSTWGRQAAPGLKFFSSEGTLSHGLPVVSLAGTDDTYPPQKKVYRMLKYMYDNFINEFNWFMRADDDVYVRVDPLVSFLNTLDSSTDLYIGQPGIGKPGDWERIQLYPSEHYCMGGTGVILSRSLLIKLGPHLEECLVNVVVSWNEDLEVGRCIMRRLGVQCTWNYEVRLYAHSNYV